MEYAYLFQQPLACGRSEVTKHDTHGYAHVLRHFVNMWKAQVVLGDFACTNARTEPEAESEAETETFAGAFIAAAEEHLRHRFANPDQANRTPQPHAHRLDSGSDGSGPRGLLNIAAKEGVEVPKSEAPAKERVEVPKSLAAPAKEGVEVPKSLAAPAKGA